MMAGDELGALEARTSVEFIEHAQRPNLGRIRGRRRGGRLDRRSLNGGVRAGGRPFRMYIHWPWTRAWTPSTT